MHALSHNCPHSFYQSNPMYLPLSFCLCLYFHVTFNDLRSIAQVRSCHAVTYSIHFPHQHVCRQLPISDDGAPATKCFAQHWNTTSPSDAKELHQTLKPIKYMFSKQIETNT